MKRAFYILWLVVRATASFVWDTLLFAGAVLIFVGAFWFARDYLPYALAALVAIVALCAIVGKMILIYDKDQNGKRPKMR